MGNKVKNNIKAGELTVFEKSFAVDCCGHNVFFECDVKFCHQTGRVHKLIQVLDSVYDKGFQDAKSYKRPPQRTVKVSNMTYDFGDVALEVVPEPVYPHIELLKPASRYHLTQQIPDNFLKLSQDDREEFIGEHMTECVQYDEPNHVWLAIVEIATLMEDAMDVYQKGLINMALKGDWDDDLHNLNTDDVLDYSQLEPNGIINRLRMGLDCD